MTFAEFSGLASASRITRTLPPSLEALLSDAGGDWDAAHAIVQQSDTPDAAWVHAYLHRKEGDQGNAAYWYACAGRPVADSPLNQEWEAIARALLNDPG